MVLDAVLLDALDNLGADRLLGPRSAQHSGADAARLLVPVQDLGDAAVRDAQLARDDARADAGRRQLDDLEPDVVRKWPAVDEHSAQLVHAPLTCGHPPNGHNNPTLA